MFITAVVMFIVAMVVWAGLRKLMVQVERHAANILSVVAHDALVGGLMLAGLLIVWSTFVVIPAGHVGAASLFGSVQPHP